jgi:hypothetical protein
MALDVVFFAVQCLWYGAELQTQMQALHRKETIMRLIAFFIAGLGIGYQGAPPVFHNYRTFALSGQKF